MYYSNVNARCLISALSRTRIKDGKGKPITIGTVGHCLLARLFCLHSWWIAVDSLAAKTNRRQVISDNYLSLSETNLVHKIGSVLDRTSYDKNIWLTRLKVSFFALIAHSFMLNLAHGRISAGIRPAKWLLNVYLAWAAFRSIVIDSSHRSILSSNSFLIKILVIKTHYIGPHYV